MVIKDLLLDRLLAAVISEREWTFCILVILWKLEVLRYSSDKLRQFRSTNHRRHVVNDGFAKRVDYYDLHVWTTLRRGRKCGRCIKLRR